MYNHYFVHIWCKEEKKTLLYREKVQNLKKQPFVFRLTAGSQNELRLINLFCKNANNEYLLYNLQQG